MARRPIEYGGAYEPEPSSYATKRGSMSYKARPWWVKHMDAAMKRMNELGREGLSAREILAQAEAEFDEPTSNGRLPYKES